MIGGDKSDFVESNLVLREGSRDFLTTIVISNSLSNSGWNMVMAINVEGIRGCETVYKNRSVLVLEL